MFVVERRALDTHVRSGSLPRSLPDSVPSIARNGAERRFPLKSDTRSTDRAGASSALRRRQSSTDVAADANGERLDDAYVHACEELSARNPCGLVGAAVDRAAGLPDERDAEIHPATDAGMQDALHSSRERVQRFQSTRGRADSESSRGAPTSAEYDHSDLARWWSRATGRSASGVVEVGDDPGAGPAHRYTGTGSENAELPHHPRDAGKHAGIPRPNAEGGDADANRPCAR
jgi:hypothetical protein